MYRFIVTTGNYPGKTERSGGLTTRDYAPNTSVISLNSEFTEHCQLRLTAGREVGPGGNVSVEIFGKTSEKCHQHQEIQYICPTSAFHSPRTQTD